MSFRILGAFGVLGVSGFGAARNGRNSGQDGFGCGRKGSGVEGIGYGVSGIGVGSKGAVYDWILESLLRAKASRKQ